MIAHTHAGPTDQSGNCPECNRIWPDLAPKYLVYTTKERGHGDVYLFWKPKRSGYTRYVEEAGRYSLQEATSLTGDGENGAVPLDVVQHYQKSVLQIGVLHEGLEPGVHGKRQGEES